MIREFEGKRPDSAKAAFVAASAELIGDVSLGEGASVWHGSVLRGDVAGIRIGKRTNIQDGAIVHVSRGLPCEIGDDVVVGHRAVVHACTVGPRSLVGMGAVILDGAVIGEESIVGAGALVTQGKVFPARSMILGNPARLVRQLREEEARAIPEQASAYVELAARARASGGETASS
jgi:carbonic anhydrase/acetyltransferase-like protein (isoleucine patch superfamily)